MKITILLAILLRGSSAFVQDDSLLLLLSLPMLFKQKGFCTTVHKKTADYLKNENTLVELMKIAFVIISNIGQ